MVQWQSSTVATKVYGPQGWNIYYLTFYRKFVDSWPRIYTENSYNSMGWGVGGTNLIEKWGNNMKIHKIYKIYPTITIKRGLTSLVTWEVITELNHLIIPSRGNDISLFQKTIWWLSIKKNIYIYISSALYINSLILFLQSCPQRNTCTCACASAHTHTQKQLESCSLKHSLSITKPVKNLASQQ